MYAVPALCVGRLSLTDDREKKRREKEIRRVFFSTFRRRGTGGLKNAERAPALRCAVVIIRVRERGLRLLNCGE